MYWRQEENMFILTDLWAMSPNTSFQTLPVNNALSAIGIWKTSCPQAVPKLSQTVPRLPWAIPGPQLYVHITCTPSGNKQHIFCSLLYCALVKVLKFSRPCWLCVVHFLLLTRCWLVVDKLLCSSWQVLVNIGQKQ